MKQFLLQDVSFGKFPPAGSHIRGISAIMFEGLLVHCELRTQLYAFTRSGTYNPRSIGTLDNENFFGAFQDFDAKGTGILHCSEVPLAMTTACELYSTRHDLKRGFYMHTTKAKVYPQKDLMDTQDDVPDVAADDWRPPTVVHDIVLRNHPFDGYERAARKAKRKRSSITPACEPARGTLGVRYERFRLNESKIPCHIREGIDVSQLPIDCM